MSIKMNQIKEIVNRCAGKLSMEIISVDYLKESGMNILRIIARKEPVFTIDDSSELNMLISNELDKVDLIDEQYYLEVSSEGIERELRNDIEIKQAIGEYVCIRLYEKYNGKKEYYGDLLDFKDEQLRLEIMDKIKKKEIVIEKDKVAKIRLAVKF